MMTRGGATTYYRGPNGTPAGFEYDLAKAFAEWLGVELRVQETQRFSDLLPSLNRHHGDLVAANLTVTQQRAAQIRFGPTYNKTHSLVVYRRGEQAPKTPRDLLTGRLAVIAGSSYAETLAAVHVRYPELQWTELADAGIEDLLNAVSEGELDYTIIDENLFTLNSPFFPKVRRGFTIGPETELAWAFPKDADGSLMLAARQFIDASTDNKLIVDLQRRYYKHLNQYTKIETYTYLKQVRQRLPRLRHMFEAAADELDLDWRLLAAVGYQESHWNPKAISPTGVRGVMMLTQNTARQLGISNRTDPRQSIFGGARYLNTIIQRLPDRIEYPDRIWLALAAYNVGYGHLEDARILTERQGGDPDSWLDVSERLPLLARKQYYSELKFGYARGHTAVKYVERIRAYYEILMWMDMREHPLLDLEQTRTAQA